MYLHTSHFYSFFLSLFIYILCRTYNTAFLFFPRVKEYFTHVTFTTYVPETSMMHKCDMAGWGRGAASASSGGGVSPSEEHGHIILQEMIVVHHFKPLIDRKAISGRADNCIISVYIN